MTHGFIFLNKPTGITSRKALDTILRKFKLKGGNEGTLDPFASGVLIIGIGKATRYFQYFQHLTKTYRAKLLLGQQTDTLDPEGSIVVQKAVPALKEEQIQAALESFQGKQEQIPPKYSALRVQGKRAYKLARQGQDFVLKKRTVTISSLKLLAFRAPYLEFECTVSSGTYIRALARDLAQSLHTVGHLVELERIGIGNFEVTAAKNMAHFEQHSKIDKLIEPVGPTLYWLPQLHLNPQSGWTFKNGGLVSVPTHDDLYRVYHEADFLGVGQVIDGQLKPKTILPQQPS